MQIAYMWRHTMPCNKIQRKEIEVAMGFKVAYHVVSCIDTFQELLV